MQKLRMLVLMKCELQKMKWRNYLLVAFLVIAMMGYFMVVAMYSNLNESGGPGTTYHVMFRNINVFMMDGFNILGSVLIAKLIVEEYTDRTIFLLFSYPVKKEKLFWSKFAVINIFTLGGIILGDVLCMILVTLLDNSNDSLIGDISTGNILYGFAQILYGVFFTLVLEFLPVAIGLWKKSISMTVIMSLLACSILHLIASQCITTVQIVSCVCIISVIILSSASCIIRNYVKNLEKM